MVYLRSFRRNYRPCRFGNLVLDLAPQESCKMTRKTRKNKPKTLATFASCEEKHFSSHTYVCVVQPTFDSSSKFPFPLVLVRPNFPFSSWRRRRGEFLPSLLSSFRTPRFLPLPLCNPTSRGKSCQPFSSTEFFRSTFRTLRRLAWLGTPVCACGHSRRLSVAGREKRTNSRLNSGYGALASCERKNAFFFQKLASFTVVDE